jgi:hypothetical protein
VTWLTVQSLYFFFRISLQASDKLRKHAINWNLKSNLTYWHFTYLCYGLMHYFGQIKLKRKEWENIKFEFWKKWRKKNFKRKIILTRGGTEQWLLLHNYWSQQSIFFFSKLIWKWKFREILIMFRKKSTMIHRKLVQRIFSIKWRTCPEWAKSRDVQGPIVYFFLL